MSLNVKEAEGRARAMKQSCYATKAGQDCDQHGLGDDYLALAALARELAETLEMQHSATVIYPEQTDAKDAVLAKARAAGLLPDHKGEAHEKDEYFDPEGKRYEVGRRIQRELNARAAGLLPDHPFMPFRFDGADACSKSGCGQPEVTHPDRESAPAETKEGA